LQASFENINKYAAYVPCAAYSLKLFRGKAAYTVTEVDDCLRIAQHFRDFCSGPSRTPVF